MSNATPDAPARPARPRGVQQVFEVASVETLSPHLVRVHLGGPAFEAFIGAASAEKLAATDKYVKLLMAKPGLDIHPPFDLDALRQTLAPEDLPVRRTYTVRSVDREAGTIAIDFVVHGDEGIAGPWAAAAKPGDLLALSGPGGDYSPSDDQAVFHLLLGDDSSLPAIAAALESMRRDATGLALIEIGGDADELDLRHPDGVAVLWLHRDATDALPGTLLADAVAALPRPAGDARIFAHGERDAMKAIRAIVHDDWGIDREKLSLSAYWANGRAEDRFQAEKREPVGQIFE